MFGGPVLPKGGSDVSLSYRDQAFAGRLGWQEVVVQPAAGAQVVRSSVPARSVSRELRAYPKSFLQTPLSVSSATRHVHAGRATSARRRPCSRGANLDRPAEVYTGADARFSQLIAKDGLSPVAIALALLAAMGLGMLHALTPGHGKSIVAAYLVGTRGRARHALYLGATVTVSHTFGVFALGIVTLSLSAFILPEDALPLADAGLGAAGGGHRAGGVPGAAPEGPAPAAGGGGVSAAEGLPPSPRRSRSRSPHDHDHDHDHHDGPGGHSHAPQGEPSLRQLIGVGISGGILPCPSALVVLLSAIALHRVAFGLALITAFSLGLASVVSGIGLIVLYARGIAARIPRSGSVINVLPAVSSAVITVAGLVIVLRALPALT